MCFWIWICMVCVWKWVFRIQKLFCRIKNVWSWKFLGRKLWFEKMFWRFFNNMYRIFKIFWIYFNYWILLWAFLNEMHHNFVCKILKAMGNLMRALWKNMQFRKWYKIISAPLCMYNFVVNIFRIIFHRVQENFYKNYSFHMKFINK